ncbi:hypothetical protein [Mesorhizobium sp. A623]
MDMRTIKGRILLGKMAARIDDANGAAGFLKACQVWGNRIAEFSHEDALAVANESYTALRTATKDFIEVGGNRNCIEFVDAVDAAKHLGSLIDDVVASQRSEPEPEHENMVLLAA